MHFSTLWWDKDDMTVGTRIKERGSVRCNAVLVTQFRPTIHGMFLGIRRKMGLGLIGN